MQITELDELVYRIIGNESKVLDGLNVPDSSGSYAAAGTIASEMEQPFKKRRYSASKNQFDSKMDEKSVQKQQLKIEWLDLQCKISRQDLQLKEKKMILLDKDMHLRDLQIIKMERELEISLHSVVIEESIEEGEE